MAINSFQAPKSPIEAISNALSVVNQIQGIRANSATLEKAAREAELAQKEQDKLRLANDATSPLSQAAREGYGKALGITIPETESYTSLERIHGSLQDISKEARARTSKREEADQALSRDKELAAFKASLEKKNQGAKKDFEKLPIESQEQIKDISKKMAAQKVIKSSIDAAISVFENPDVPEDQKIVQGRQLIKTLNSKEGSDAVGAEEAKRLGSLLEYKVGNFTQPGSFIGRDLDKFIDQVRLTSASLSDGLNRSVNELDSLYGRSPTKQVGITLPSGFKKQSSGLIKEANAAAPTDPNIDNYAKSHGLGYDQAEQILKARGYGQ